MPGCKEIAFRKEVERNLNVCGKCGHHFRVTLSQRLSITADRGSWRELFADIAIGDPLEFVDSKPYPGRIEAARKSSGRNDAVVVGTASIEEHPIALAIMDFDFMGGSMGVVVGEKLARLFDHALTNSLPMVLFAASGGARMQEGALSLMQMAKVSSAIARFRDARLPFISVLCDPTTGGVAASFAMLGDLNISEPGALIGFAGRRVTKQTTGADLPADFQRAEFLARARDARCDRTARTDARDARASACDVASPESCGLASEDRGAGEEIVRLACLRSLHILDSILSKMLRTRRG